VVGHWSREVSGSPSMEALRARLDKALGSLLNGSPAHGRLWNWMDFKVPSKPSHSVIHSMIAQGQEAFTPKRRSS